MRRKSRKGAQVKESRVVFRGGVFRVWRDIVVEPPLPGQPPKPAKRSPAVTREIVEHGGSVVVLPVLADGRILLVRQYRYAVDDFLWELVAGHIEPGETPLQAARRELREETGYGARRFERLLEFFPTPGILSERMILYRATGLKPGKASPKEDEMLETRAFRVEELRRRLPHGGLRDAKTLVGVLLQTEKRRRRL